MKLLDIFRKNTAPSGRTADVCEPTEPLGRTNGSDTLPVFPGITDSETAYLTDENGNVYSIGSFPYVIGRKSTSEGTDLSLADIPEISGVHAVLTFEKGKYFIGDNNSTNGTFVQKENCELFSAECRIRKEELSDGSVFWLYRTMFVFHTDSTSSQTCIINSAAAFQSAATLPLNSDNRTDKDLMECRAVISDSYTETMIYDFPYENSEPAFCIEKALNGSRTVYFIRSDKAVRTEGEESAPGEKAELFSGCHFSVDSKEYTFYIK